MSLDRLKELAGITTITEAKVNLGELVDKFLDANKLYSFDGPSGVRKFVQLTKALDPQYKDVESFLEDNPGAFEALISFISKSNVKEWAERLSKDLPKDGEE